MNRFQMKSEKPSLRGSNGLELLAFPVTLPLYQGYGSHYFEVYVGSPYPQRQTLLVDTGSDHIAIPCSQCKDCGSHTDLLFNEKRSYTFQQISCPESDRCEMNASYAEGSSWKGVLAKDVVHVGRMEKPGISFDPQFVCMERNDNEFRKQLANGIVGMNASPQSFPSQLFFSGAISQNSFSICYRQDLHASLRGTIAGAITFGGVDRRFYGGNTEMKYANLFTRNGFYFVSIRKIWLRDEGKDNLLRVMSESELSLPSANSKLKSQYTEAIIDSGTTDSHFDISYKELFDKAWKELTGTDFPSDEVYISPAELKLWPTIIIQLQGAFTIAEKWNSILSDSPRIARHIFDEDYPDDVLVALHPSQYMKFSVSSKTYRPHLSFDEMYGRRTVLGSNFMDGSLMEFDVENQRIGIVESECDYIHATTGKHSGNVLDPYASIEEMNAYVIRSILSDRFSSDHTFVFIICAIFSFIYVVLKIRLQFRLQRRRSYKD